MTKTYSYLPIRKFGKNPVHIVEIYIIKRQHTRKCIYLVRKKKLTRFLVFDVIIQYNFSEEFKSLNRIIISRAINEILLIKRFPVSPFEFPRLFPRYSLHRGMRSNDVSASIRSHVWLTILVMDNRIEPSSFRRAGVQYFTAYLFVQDAHLRVLTREGDGFLKFFPRGSPARYFISMSARYTDTLLEIYRFNRTAILSCYLFQS